MWLDEALTVNVARLPLGDLRAALEHDGAPPLYYVLLHVWTGVFGAGNARRDRCRRCSASAVGWAVVRGRRLVAPDRVVVVVVTATNPYLIRYATEARMYMLEVLLVVCGIVVVRGHSSGRRLPGSLWSA